MNSKINRKPLKKDFPGNFFTEIRRPRPAVLIVCSLVLCASLHSQGTRLLRQPAITSNQITFAYGGDIWISDFEGQKILRLTSTPR